MTAIGSCLSDAIRKERAARWARAFVAASVLFVGMFQDANAVNPLGAAVGVIRWDAWVGDQPTPGVGADYAGLQAEAAMSPNKYHYRLPFYAVETGTNSVQVRMDSQAKMDAEIVYAQNAHIGFWAFDYYPDGSGQEYARHAYEASAYRSTIKFAHILGVSGIDVPAIVTDFQKSFYQKVLDNRPLVFLYTYPGSPLDAGTVATIRNAAAAAGVANPYVVVLNPNSNDAANWAVSLGAEAVSAYATPHGVGGRSPSHEYPHLMQAEAARWDSHNWAAWQVGKKIVPWVTTGWDPRPLVDNPPTWGTWQPDNWTNPASNQQIASHLQHAIDWSVPHAGEAEANVILMYAWNEFAEGGWICPTLANGADRVTWVGEVLREGPSTDPNITNVYRFRHDGSYVDRFFTTNYVEGVNGGYVAEGIGFTTYANPIDSNMYPLYRCNSGRHFISAAANCEGFSNEGSYGYVSSVPRSGFAALYRFQRGYEHLATTNYSEGNGWNYEGILGYVRN